MDKKKKTKKICFLARFRWLIQAAAVILTNIHLPNFFKGTLYQGKGKYACVPGLNCYSCPGACPIGAFQAVIGSSKFKFSYYITGTLILMGVLLGRFICGFLCPFGWLQELLHKIPVPKLSTRKLKPLRYLKYVILAVFVIMLPLIVAGSCGGRYSAGDSKRGHTQRSRSAVLLENRRSAGGCHGKYVYLPAVLQMDLSAGSSLCAAEPCVAFPDES